MCGINGFISEHNIEKNSLQIANDLITHRGPDSDGVFYDHHMGKYIGLGMRRLSIIDLTSGAQPIIADNGNLVIVFNGEIYNYIQLKQKLLKNHKVKFKTDSDTEVILKMYQHYGEDSFSEFDGMFAFSILDKKKGKIFLARDFFGEKPLYIYNTNENIIWASELKSILHFLKEKPEINIKALNLFFQLTYIPAPYTIYEGIKKIRPNHYLKVDLKTNSIEEKQIDSKLIKTNKSTTLSDAKKQTHDLVQESVFSRSISDVPIGSFLSGGVDSSIVSLCLAKDKSTSINTFSLGFEKKSFDETDKSRLVAKLIKSNHHEFIVSSKDLEEDIEKVILNYDEPFADSSALPTYLVSKLTRKHVKVALTGDGGDEVFGGYNKYYTGKLNNIYTKIIPEFIHSNSFNFFEWLLRLKDDNRGLTHKVKKLLESIDYENKYYQNIISLGFKSHETKKLIKQHNNTLKEYFINNKTETINDYRSIDRLISLEGDMLVKVDRASMLNSLECRAPFLNKKLWYYSNSLPENFLIHGWNKKYILKLAFEKYFPDKFLEKSKSGFGIPVGDWLRTILKEELEKYIERDFLNSQNLFNTDYIIPIVKNHLTQKSDNTFKVWTFYCFQKWYSKTYNK